MKVLNIEVLSGRSVLLQTRPSGDVEVVVSKLVPTSGEVIKWPTKDAKKPKNMGHTCPGGRHDTVICVVPKHRRNLVADFLRTEP